MSLNHLTRMFSLDRRDPRPDVNRRSSTSTLYASFAVIAIVLFAAFGSQGQAQGAQRVLPSGAKAPASSAYGSARTSNASSLPAKTRAAEPIAKLAQSTDDTQVDAQSAPEYVPNGQTVRNERCVQKTFKAPTDKDAALIGTFLLRLLPENLRDQTSWRYNDKENTLTVYGPEKAIEFSENLLNDFSEPLYEAFLTSGEFVGVAGVAPNSKPQLGMSDAQAAEALKAAGPSYYDPERNDVVKVAYEAQGAIVPDRQNYAVTFGGGTNPSRQPAAQDDSNVTAAQVWGQSPEVQAAAENDDAILDVVSYRCLPTASDRVGLLVQRQFAGNPAIAFSVDRNLGTIVVHTTRKLQREVAAYLAQLHVYPDVQSNNEPDLRVATGAITEIDGYNADETPSERRTRQAFSGNQTSMVAGPFAEQAQSGEIDDVYRPQYRKAEELQDALLQLFGERLQRRDSNPNDPYSKRQIATYRFVKRQNPDDPELHTCDVSIDALHNQVFLQGDGSLCAQMLTLLRAMDQPPLRNGNVRRFIPIRNGDTNKIRQILEYDSPKNARNLRSFNSNYALDQVVERLTNNSQATRLYERALPVSERFAPYFSDVASNADRRACEQDAAPVLSPAKALQAAYRSVDRIAKSETTPSNGVRQVSYQEDGGLPAAPQADALDPNDYDRDRQGVGVVQDFTPTVLDGIDVVIVDNATNAEYERIKQMIEQIEELAKIADVQTEIYNLEHVDCAMLHGVLTTLYTEMFTNKQGRVVFYALQNPNAILVAGWGQAFKDMKDLIELFDQPIKDGAGTLRVVHLQYAAVDEIATLLSETFVTPQTTGTGGFAPRIRAFADVRTNSLVVQAAPNDWDEIQKLLMELDVNKATTKLATRVFPLKNSLAENIRTTIMNAILPAKQGTLDTSAAKFPVLQLLSVDDSGRKLVESGIMMDVDVVADVYHNQLIVNAPEDCMEFMERLVEMLDVAPKKAQIRFFQVRHGDASQILQTLQSLLATTDNNLSTPTLPQADEEETFVPVRFALDTRTNVIIAAAAPKELAIVDALIVALDVKDSAVREEVVVQLRNIQALVVAQALEDYLSQKQTLETQSEVLSNYQLYESQVIVIPESISNSIIVSASPEEMDNILKMIRTFDKDAPQVVIQVLIAEVTLSDHEEFGIEAGLQDSVSFDRSLITTTSSGSTGDPGFNIVGSSGPGQNMSSSSSVTDVAGQVLNNFAMGSTNSTLGYGGFVVSASSRSIDVTLRALREKDRLQVLSRPQVTAMDNQQAFILVGQRVPRISGTTTTNYGVQMNTTDTPVGLILLVTPRVTQDGKVVMEIGAEKSDLGNDSDATPIYSQDGQVIKSKSINTVQAMTAISARDGETVMIGGLLTSSKEKINRGVPYLSDVPVLGWLFRYDQEIESRKELLIVMTPRIMRSNDDYAETLRVEMNRTNIDLNDAMEVNGNMGLYDPRTNQGRKDKKTKSLLYQAIHPDKMDDLDNIPEYSPTRDYAPRPEWTSPENPYDRKAKTSTTSVSAASEKSDGQDARSQYSWDQDAPVSKNASFPLINDDEGQSDDVLILDDYSSNDKKQTAKVARVAMRNDDTQRGATRTTSSKKNSQTSSKSTRASQDSTRGQVKSTKSNDSDDLSDARSSRRNAVERYDAVNSASIRGQAPAEEKSKAVPLSRMKESRGFKLFHWTTLTDAD